MAGEKITLIGLGKIGSSIGLALAKSEDNYKLVGHDIDTAVAKKAVSMGAVKSSSWNLLRACDAADVVILAIPLDQVRETLELIGPDLKPGCVVIDTSPVKSIVIQWAESYLSDDAHFVGISLGTNPAMMGNLAPGPGGARADLFADSPCGIVPSPTCRPEAIKVAQDFVALLKATPHFLDPAEFDGVSTAVNLMPALVAGALVGPITDSPGWREMRRLASSDLFHFSQPLTAGAPALAQAAVLNKETVLAWLDSALAELQKLRGLIAEEQQEMLMLHLESALQAREKWTIDWQVNLWDRKPQVEMPASPGMFGQLFGFGRRRDKDG